MKGTIAYCGYRCDLCPAFSRNINGEEDRKKVSRDWRRIFGFDIPPEKVECVGCINDGYHVDKNCPVRSCATDRGVDACTRCTDYSCKELLTRTEFTGEFMKGKGRHLSRDDYDRYIRPYEVANKPKE